MEFNLFNIDQRSETEILLYGKFLSDEPIVTLKVTNIFSPVFFLPSKNKEDILKEEIIAFFKSNRCEVVDLTKDVGSEEIEIGKNIPSTTSKNGAEKVVVLEKINKANIFYKAQQKKLKMFKVTSNFKISIAEFDSEYSEISIFEFTNPIENFIVSKKIQGPGILRIEGLVKNTTKMEDVYFLKNSKFPPLQVAAIAFEMRGAEVEKFVYCNKSKGIVIDSEKSYDISRLSYLSGQVRCLESLPGVYNKLGKLNEIIAKDSPDIVLVHNFHGKYKLNIKDRIFCDIFSFASGVIKGRDFSISEICQNYRIAKNKGLEGDALAIIDIFGAMDALSLGKEMAEISGYLLNRCLSNCRAERIEYTLLHELYEKNYLFPPFVLKQNVKYSGGLVLDPAQGFYEDIVLLLDFNSLYPSIIQEFNVCFSNIGSGNFYLKEDNEKDFLSNPDLLSSMAENQDDSFLPKILRNLVRRRRVVKECLKNSKNEEERAVLDIRQRAIKLTANSIYGCLGSPISRFCNFEMAAFITAKGRELLSETRIIAEELNMRVIYGDTDSIMVHTKFPGNLQYYDMAMESANSLILKINGKYKNIEIELEKQFKKLLLYTKKKYAGLVFDKKGSSVEIKGIDVVRRDFCVASNELNRTVLNIMLQDRESYCNSNELLNGDQFNNSADTCEKIYLACSNFFNSLEKRPVEDFIVSVLLAKDIDSYGEGVALPHISLAKRLRESKKILYRQDDIVSYVIGEGKGSISERAFHPDENFSIDYNYYVKNQILPSLFRLINILKFIQTDKISLIFNVKSFGPKIIQKSVTILTPCCDFLQEVSLSCLKCKKPIDPYYIKCKAANILRQGALNCYSQKGKCLDCGVVYKSCFYKCYTCNKELFFEFQNKEFDELLSSVEESFSSLGLPDLDNLINMYLDQSAYKTIDVSKYFKKELALYERLKSLK